MRWSRVTLSKCFAVKAGKDIGMFNFTCDNQGGVAERDVTCFSHGRVFHLLTPRQVWHALDECQVMFVNSTQMLQLVVWQHLVH